MPNMYEEVDKLVENGIVRKSMSPSYSFAVVSNHYLSSGHHFKIQIDHWNVTYIYKSTTPMIVCWQLALFAFDFGVNHIQGKQNVVTADALLRVLAVSQSSIYIKYHKLYRSFMQTKLGKCIYNTDIHVLYCWLIWYWSSELHSPWQWWWEKYQQWK